MKVFGGFCVITLLKWSLGPKNGLERRVWQFYTICDKNLLLKPKTRKVMAILVPRWLDSSWQVRLQMCLKVCMVIFANRTRAQTRSAITPMFLLEDLRSAQITFSSTWWSYFEHLATPRVTKQKLWYCSFGKIKNPGTNVDFAFFKIVW